MGLFGAKMWVQVGSKMAKKALFISATSLPTQFFQKSNFLTVIVSYNTLSKLKDQLTVLHKGTSTKNFSHADF